MSPDATLHFGGPLTEHELDVRAGREMRVMDPLSLLAGTGIKDVEKADDELLGEIAIGNRESLALIFRRHGPAVAKVARRLMKDDGEAEDLLQDVFLFVFERATLFDPSKGTGISWIIQIAYHRAIDRRRYLNSRQHYSSQEFREEAQAPVVRQTTMDQIACRELLVKFQEELTPEQRETLELHFFQGYTFHEIAEKTGQTLGNIRHRYYRGLEKLRSFVVTRKRD